MGIWKSGRPHANSVINRASHSRHSTSCPIGVIPDKYINLSTVHQTTLYIKQHCTSNNIVLLCLYPAVVDLYSFSLGKRRLSQVHSQRLSIMSDEIYIQNLRLSAIVGPDAWHRLHKPQPVTLSARLHINTSAAGSSDDIRETVSYGEICKVITACIEGYESFSCIRQLGWRISALAEEQKWGGEKFEVEVILPKGLLRAEGGIGFRCCVVRNRDGQGTEPQWRDGEDFEWLIKDLNLACVIGVNPHERVEKQSVLINLCILSCFIDDYELDHTQDHWQKLVKRNCEVRDALYNSFLVRNEHGDITDTQLGHRVLRIRDP